MQEEEVTGEVVPGTLDLTAGGYWHLNARALGYRRETCGNASYLDDHNPKCNPLLCFGTSERRRDFVSIRSDTLMVANTLKKTKSL